MTTPIWFSSFSDLMPVLVKAVCSYPVLVLFVRLCGKRSTSRMNNFDWIVTVAVGSLFASTVILDEVPFVEGILAIALLHGLQWLMTFSTSRWHWAQRLIMAPPQLLLYRGKYLEQAMRKERISKQELQAAMREQGVPKPEDVLAIVMEPNAELSVLTGSDETDGDIECLAGVTGYADCAEPSPS